MTTTLDKYDYLHLRGEVRKCLLGPCDESTMSLQREGCLSLHPAALGKGAASSEQKGRSIASSISSMQMQCFTICICQSPLGSWKHALSSPLRKREKRNSLPSER